MYTKLPPKLWRLCVRSEDMRFYVNLTYNNINTPTTIFAMVQQDNVAQSISGGSTIRICLIGTSPALKGLVHSTICDYSQHSTRPSPHHKQHKKTATSASYRAY